MPCDFSHRNHKTGFTQLAHISLAGDRVHGNQASPSEPVGDPGWSRHAHTALQPALLSSRVSVNVLGVIFA
jgi:hypothetical protein